MGMVVHDGHDSCVRHLWYVHVGWQGRTARSHFLSKVCILLVWSRTHNRDKRQTRSDSQTAEADGRIVHLEQFDVSSDWLPVKMHQKAQPSEGDLQEQLHAPRSFHIHHLNSCSTRYRCT